MKQIFTLMTLVIGTLYYSQVGINTSNPQGTFNVDGAKDNATSGTPTITQQSNDFVITSAGSVGIGTTVPDTSSFLDITSTDKGILIPRVNLTSSTMDLDGVGLQPTGLFVFNAGSTLPAGFYFWNGTEWRIVNNSTSLPGTIASLQCSSAYTNPQAFTISTAYTGSLHIPYTGGNGGAYSTSSFIDAGSGLNFTLQADNLKVGSGEIVYDITGTPTFSSPTTKSIPISFLGKSCNVVIGNVVSSMNFTKGTTTIDTNTLTNSVITFGSLSLRYTGSNPTNNVGEIEFKTSQATEYSLKYYLYGNGGASDFGDVKVSNITANTWTQFTTGSNVSPDHNDLLTGIIVLQNLKEVYRITVNTNSNTSTTPNTAAQITFFIEKLN
ncbi:hypothetical protein DBR39_01375 [Chryseobacterium sp. KBW03]|uniref:hypothetical protein n=1 Tax=Chryseobacterium sp. KBW03 TaxID=2153362 RepID=UPI000F5A4D16|nr:hypothetical protein [Chryseobacterium sp. KBW03]RQO42556.1 hypothetical protein DBR39_01375 [Chryseobacterium sp. KBW03]